MEAASDSDGKSVNASFSLQTGFCSSRDGFGRHGWAELPRWVRVALASQIPVVPCGSGVSAQFTRGAWRRLVLFLEGKISYSWTQGRGSTSQSYVAPMRAPRLLLELP